MRGQDRDIQDNLGYYNYLKDMTDIRTHKLGEERGQGPHTDQEKDIKDVNQNSRRDLKKKQRERSIISEDIKTCLKS